MMCAIVSAPHEQKSFVTGNLAGFVHDVVSGGGRVYILSFVEGRENDLSFTDPFDAALLIECRFFDNEGAARRWIAVDIALRSAPIRRVH